MPLVVIKNYFPGVLHQEVYKKRIKMTYAGLIIGQKQKLSYYFGKNLTIGYHCFLFCLCLDFCDMLKLFLNYFNQ